MKKNWLVVIVCVLAGCGGNQQQPQKQQGKSQESQKKEIKKSTKEYTSKKELEAYSQREKQFNRVLANFSRSRDFNERNLSDLLLLIELEIKAIDYLLFGPRWNFRQTVNEKNQILQNVSPIVKRIYKLCVAMTENETDELEQGFKTEYLRGVRASLKRYYAKVRSLEAILLEHDMTVDDTHKRDDMFGVSHPPREKIVESQVNSEVKELKEKIAKLEQQKNQQPMMPVYGAAPTIIQVPVPVAQPISSQQYYQQPPVPSQSACVPQVPVQQEARQAISLEKQQKIQKHLDRLGAVDERLQRYQRNKDVISKDVSGSIEQQAQHAKELIKRIKKQK